MLFSFSGSLFFSLVNRWSSEGINQTHCSSGWALGFAPDWVMLVDIEPSGSHWCCWCFLLSSVFLWCCCSGLFLTLFLSWQCHTSAAYDERLHHTENKTFRKMQDTCLLRFPLFSPYIALSSDSGVPGLALFPVMDDPLCSAVATVIDLCW